MPLSWDWTLQRSWACAGLLTFSLWEPGLGPQVWPLELRPAGCGGNGSLEPTLLAGSMREPRGVQVEGNSLLVAGPDSLESGGPGEAEMGISLARAAWLKE